MNDVRASMGNDGPSGFGQNLAARVRAGWPDALRMVLASVGSFALSQALHLPEAFWAVLTALVASRPHAAGTARAGIDRLVGTIMGAAVATAFALTHLHLTQLELLFAVLVPLCLLVALHENYRAAPVAALIVLSGGMLGQSPVNTALYRTSEIAVGALVAFLVSALVLPRRSEAKALQRAAAVTGLLSRFIELVLVPPPNEERTTDRLKEQVRAELRALTLLTHTSRWKRTSETGMAKLTRLLSALNADMGFIERTLARSPVKEEAAAFPASVREIAAAFQVTLSQAAAAFTGQATAPRIDVIDGSLASLETQRRSAEPAGITPQHLLFLLHTLREDCRRLCLLLSANQRAA